MNHILHPGNEVVKAFTQLRQYLLKPVLPVASQHRNADSLLREFLETFAQTGRFTLFPWRTLNIA